MLSVEEIQLKIMFENNEEEKNKIFNKHHQRSGLNPPRSNWDSGPDFVGRVPISSHWFRRFPTNSWSKFCGTFPTKSGPESCSKEIVGIQRRRPKINGIYRIRCRKTTGSGGRNSGPGQDQKNKSLQLRVGINFELKRWQEVINDINILEQTIDSTDLQVMKIKANIQECCRKARVSIMNMIDNGKHTDENEALFFNISQKCVDNFIEGQVVTKSRRSTVTSNKQQQKKPLNTLIQK